MPHSAKLTKQMKSVCIVFVPGVHALTYRRGRSLLSVIMPSVKRIICAHNGGGIQINYDGAEVC